MRVQAQYQLPGCHGQDGSTEFGSDVSTGEALEESVQGGSSASQELIDICPIRSTKTASLSNI